MISGILNAMSSTGQNGELRERERGGRDVTHDLESHTIPIRGGNRARHHCTVVIPARESKQLPDYIRNEDAKTICRPYRP